MHNRLLAEGSKGILLKENQFMNKSSVLPWFFFLPNDEGDNGNDEEEGNYYNTYNAPYRNRLSDGDSIIVNS
jgi:hypothetical protein